MKCRNLLIVVVTLFYLVSCINITIPNQIDLSTEDTVDRIPIQLITTVHHYYSSESNEVESQEPMVIEKEVIITQPGEMIIKEIEVRVGCNRFDLPNLPGLPPLPIIPDNKVNDIEYLAAQLIEYIRLIQRHDAAIKLILQEVHQRHLDSCLP